MKLKKMDRHETVTFVNFSRRKKETKTKKYVETEIEENKSRKEKKGKTIIYVPIKFVTRGEGGCASTLTNI
jgi:hypothetical protein